MKEKSLLKMFMSKGAKAFYDKSDSMNVTFCEKCLRYDDCLSVYICSLY